MTDTTSMAATPPRGATVPAQGDPPDRRAWRPEDDITDSLYALAEVIDGTDPDFDTIADIAAARLLMVPQELRVIWNRRARRAAELTAGPVRQIGGGS